MSKSGVTFFDSQNLYSDDFEAKTSENMRYFKDFFFGDTTLFCNFVAEFATICKIKCCIMIDYYIHERDNWANFRWDESQVSLSISMTVQRMPRQASVLAFRAYW